MNTLINETYKEMKERHSKEMNSFMEDCVFWAFSEEQFNNGMKKLGLENTKENHSKLLRVTGGGFLLKSKSAEWDALFKRFRDEEKQAINNDKDGTGYIQEMFEYELNNHEFGYTRDTSQTLKSLGLSMEEIKANDNLLKGFNNATKAIIEWDDNNN